MLLQICDGIFRTSTWIADMELTLHVMHDVHNFIVEAFMLQWSINTDDEVDVTVKWCGHPDESEWT